MIPEDRVRQGFQPASDLHLCVLTCHTEAVRCFQPNSLFLGWSRLCKLKSKDQRSSWRIVSYEEGLCSGILCWSSLNESQMGVELTSCHTAFSSKICSNSIKFFPLSIAKPTSFLTLMTAVVSQWAIHYTEARVISFNSKLYLLPLLLTSLLWQNPDFLLLWGFAWLGLYFSLQPYPKFLFHFFTPLSLYGYFSVPDTQSSLLPWKLCSSFLCA